MSVLDEAYAFSWYIISALRRHLVHKLCLVMSTGLPVRLQAKAVAEYDAFLVGHGGLTGGWDAADHALFLKLRARHRSVTRQSHAIASNMISR